jgi:hypothetical protein
MSAINFLALLCAIVSSTMIVQKSFFNEKTELSSVKLESILIGSMFVLFVHLILGVIGLLFFNDVSQ